MTTQTKPRWQDDFDSLKKYLDANPKQQLWEAIKNWSGFAFVFGSDMAPPRLTNTDLQGISLDNLDLEIFIDQLTDTYYRDGVD